MFSASPTDVAPLMKVLSQESNTMIDSNDRLIISFMIVNPKKFQTAIITKKN